MTPANNSLHKYRADVDGLRAIAVTLVVVFHAAPSLVPGGFIGVDVFFVISGFLITNILIGELASGTFTFTHFYARRIKRIFPALILVLTATWLAGRVILSSAEYRELGTHILAGAGFVSNILLWSEAGYFDTSAEMKPLLHLWSLGVEEQYYLIWPLILWAAHRKAINLVAVAASIGIASFVANIAIVGADPVSAFYLPHTRFWELMIGSVLAMSSRSAIPSLIKRHRDSWSVAGLSLIVLAVALINTRTPFPGWWALLPTVGTALLLWAGPSAWVNRRLLAQPAMVWLGLISYPLYLWHWPILSFLARFMGEAKWQQLTKYRLAAVILSVVLAWLTRVVLESWANRRFSCHPWRVVGGAAAAMTAVALAGLFQFPAQNLTGNSNQLTRLEIFAAQNRPDGSAWQRGKCFFLPHEIKSAADSFVRNGCDGTQSDRRPLLWLVGDSHAAHLFPGLAKELGSSFNIGQMTSAFCVPLIWNMQLLATRTATKECRETNNFIFTRAEKVRPDVIVVGAHFNIYVNDADAAYPNFIHALQSSLRQLRAISGARIVVVGQTPNWRRNLTLLVSDRIRRRLEVPLLMADGLDESVFGLDRSLKAIDWGEGITYLSLIDQLCTGPDCRVRWGGEAPGDLMVVDRNHFSVAGSHFVARTVLVPAIAEVLSQVRAGAPVK